MTPPALPDRFPKRNSVSVTCCLQIAPPRGQVLIVAPPWAPAMPMRRGEMKKGNRNAVECVLFNWGRDFRLSKGKRDVEDLLGRGSVPTGQRRDSLAEDTRF